MKKYLDTLQDGATRLQIYDAELTEPAIAAVREARGVVEHQAAQLAEIGVAATNVEAAAGRVVDHLATEQPWREIANQADDLAEIRTAYEAERKRLIEQQEEATEQARRVVKRREGFSTLPGDQAHDVLRPFASVVVDTSPQAVAPTLVAIRDAFEVRLRRALDDANSTLDGILSAGPRPMIRAHDLRLTGRELVTEADVEALVAEIREQVRAGSRIRLV